MVIPSSAPWKSRARVRANRVCSTIGCSSMGKRRGVMSFPHPRREMVRIGPRMRFGVEHLPSGTYTYAYFIREGSVFFGIFSAGYGERGGTFE